MAARLERLDQPQLLLGGDPREHHGVVDHGGQVPVRQPAQFLAGQRAHRLAGRTFLFPGSAQADLLGDGPGGEHMIARDHLHLDAGRLAFLHGLNRLGSGRIELALEAEKGEFAGHVFMLQPAVMIRHLAPRKGQHAQPARGQFLGALADRLRLQRPGRTVRPQGVGATG
jgi:hypothetical protein